MAPPPSAMPPKRRRKPSLKMQLQRAHAEVEPPPDAPVRKRRVRPRRKALPRSSSPPSPPSPLQLSPPPPSPPQLAPRPSLPPRATPPPPPADPRPHLTLPHPRAAPVPLPGPARLAQPLRTQGAVAATTTSPSASSHKQPPESSPSRVLELRLWHNVSRESMPGTVSCPLHQLLVLLKVDEKLSLYVGQDLPNFRARLARLLPSPHELHAWETELSAPVHNRRVMILTPYDGRLLSIAHSPTVPELETFLTREHTEKQPADRKRLFAGGFTDVTGLSVQVRRALKCFCFDYRTKSISDVPANGRERPFPPPTAKRRRITAHPALPSMLPNDPVAVAHVSQRGTGSASQHARRPIPRPSARASRAVTAPPMVVDKRYTSPPSSSRHFGNTRLFSRKIDPRPSQSGDGTIARRPLEAQTTNTSTGRSLNSSDGARRSSAVESAIVPGGAEYPTDILSWLPKTNSVLKPNPRVTQMRESNRNQRSQKHSATVRDAEITQSYRQAPPPSLIAPRCHEHGRGVLQRQVQSQVVKEPQQPLYSSLAGKSVGNYPATTEIVSPERNLADEELASGHTVMESHPEQGIAPEGNRVLMDSQNNTDKRKSTPFTPWKHNSGASSLAAKSSGNSSRDVLPEHSKSPQVIILNREHDAKDCDISLKRPRLGALPSDCDSSDETIERLAREMDARQRALVQDIFCGSDGSEDSGCLVPITKTHIRRPVPNAGIQRHTTPSVSSSDTSEGADTLHQTGVADMKNGHRPQSRGFALCDCSSSEASLELLLEKSVKMTAQRHATVEERSLEVGQPTPCQPQVEIVSNDAHYVKEEEATLDGEGEILPPVTNSTPHSLPPSRQLELARNVRDRVLNETRNSGQDHDQVPMKMSRSSTKPRKPPQESKKKKKKRFRNEISAMVQKNLTPRGVPNQPSVGRVYSGYVYLWNHESSSRSDNLILIEDALEECAHDENEKLALYDGQDYDFENGFLASWATMFDQDLPRWASRDDDYSASGSKTLLWSETLQVLRAHNYSPLQKNLPLWLVGNLDFTVFQPNLLNPTGKPRQLNAEGKAVQYTAKCQSKCLYYFVTKRILPLIRQKCLTELQDKDLTDIDFWNVRRDCREERVPFESRATLSRFLISNPWIEIHHTQERLRQFETTNGYELVPIMTNCPAHIASFWDKELKKKILHPKDDVTFEGRTIYDCLSMNRNLELYIGQDTPYSTCISSHVNRLSRSGRFPYLYMLAACGSRVKRFFAASGWTAVHLDTKNYSTAVAVFWKKAERATIMQPELSSFISIHEYMQQNTDHELYVGQDMDTKFAKEISTWLRLLSYKPGYSRDQKPLLTKRAFLPTLNPTMDMTAYNCPLSKQSKSERGMHVKGSHSCLHDKPVLREPSKLVTMRVELAPDTDKNRDSAEKPSYAKAKKLVEAKTSDAMEASIGISIMKAKKRSSVPSQDTTNCSEENLDEVSMDPDSSTPLLAQGLNQEHGMYEDSSGSEIECPGHGPLHPHPQDLGQVVPSAERLRKSREMAYKTAQLIKEAGPKILKKELVHDLRQSIREELILKVRSIEHLMQLCAKIRSLDFIKGADELCDRLDELDTYKCFAYLPEAGYGPPDFNFLRVSLESGRIWTTSEVVELFRFIAEDLVQFHQTGALGIEAALMKRKGEGIIAKFVAEHHSLIEDEKTILDIAELCERARKVGFRSSEDKAKTKKASNVKAQAKAKPVIRVSGYQSEVTFLNYRDEKGHSIMGKRHSARVFGVCIDRKACEARAGNVRECHICDKKVLRSDGDTLQCTNAIICVCQEVVCRGCLEKVFSFTEHDFVTYRQADNWVCVHCRGLCGSAGLCGAKCKSRELAAAAHRREEVIFEWPSLECRAKTLVACIVRGSDAGVFEPELWKAPYTFELVEDIGNRAWSAKLKLRVGMYRCRILKDDEWFASTSFLVTPHSKSQPRKMTRERRGDRNTQQQYIRGSLVRSNPQHHRIRWRVSDRSVSEPVHKLTEDDGGDTVKDCSRVEGYDWRRSKRHTVAHWIPDFNGDARRVPSFGGRNKPLRLLPSCQQWSSIQEPDFPKLELGMSCHDFHNAIAAHKFDQMVSHTLWGIVAGKSEIHGIGLFTLTGYRKGDFVIEYAGELIRNPLADVREARYDAAGLGTYFFRIDELQIVDATVESNRARFTNHSCDPNMAAKIVTVRGRNLVVLHATRDIPPFSELTFNYQLPYEDKKLQCLCNSWNCVGVMN